MLGVLGIILLFFLLVLILGFEVVFFFLGYSDVKKLEDSNIVVDCVIISLKEKFWKFLVIILISNNFINIVIVILFDFVFCLAFLDEIFD